MRLTTKGRFAVTAMVDLVMRGENGPVTLASISERQKISLSYLELLFGKLRKHDLVYSERGRGGGYCLTRPASEISMYDIIVAVDESIDATQCNDGNSCITHDLWMGLNKVISSYFDSVTLQQLVTSQIPKPAATAPIAFMGNLEKSMLAYI